MTYDEFIKNILNGRGRFACGDEYCERHHILPRCIGGNNDDENLIDLYAREHFIAHKLLAQENKDNPRLVYAWCCMAFAKNDYEHRYELSPEEYEEARIALSNARKGVKIGAPSIETVEKIRQGLKRSWDNNDILKEEYSVRMRQRWSDEDYKIRVSQNIKKNCPDRSGENSPRYGKKHSVESRIKMSINHTDVANEKHPMYGKNHSEESRRKMSENHADFIGDKHPRCRTICQYDKDGNFIRVWDYIKQASDTLDIHRTDIISCCRKRLKSAGGFVWYYADDPAQPDKTKIITKQND